METTHSISDANGTVEFYLPGTFQFSKDPGRIERFVRRLLRDEGVPMPSTSGSDGHEFYLPGTHDFERRGTR